MTHNEFRGELLLTTEEGKDQYTPGNPQSYRPLGYLVPRVVRGRSTSWRVRLINHKVVVSGNSRVVIYDPFRDPRRPFSSGISHRLLLWSLCTKPNPSFSFVVGLIRVQLTGTSTSTEDFDRGRDDDRTSNDILCHDKGGPDRWLFQDTIGT